MRSDWACMSHTLRYDMAPVMDSAPAAHPPAHPFSMPHSSPAMVERSLPLHPPDAHEPHIHPFTHFLAGEGKDTGGPDGAHSTVFSRWEQDLLTSTHHIDSEAKRLGPEGVVLLP